MSEQEKQEKITELLRLSKSEKTVKQKKRYDVVLLSLEGHKSREISEFLHIPVQTVNTHIAAYKKGGAAALLIKKQPGAQRKLTEEQEQRLYCAISEYTPEEVGIGVFANWTAPLACEYVKREFNITFSKRGMLNLLHRIKLSYTRPTYTLAKANPEKQNEFREELETLKKSY